jgi:hypothetical protein
MASLNFFIRLRRDDSSKQLLCSRLDPSPLNLLSKAFYAFTNPSCVEAAVDLGWSAIVAWLSDGAFTHCHELCSNDFCLTSTILFLDMNACPRLPRLTMIDFDYKWMADCGSPCD